ncbi:hypothetical protein [Chitinimonas koreensis]|uniref:hypothetical protein n=1 Tax=Chitinimonas koreensis TaxID=356302 RepID=UPI0004037B47|nr:hypothetical protein [Chitinimonas koreensis]QNM94761.1 hypothetical protein H9L41_12510 [Chitinimonas koreensis]
MRIAARMHRSTYATTPHPVLAIDGTPLDVWLQSQTGEADILGLVPAQGWLVDETELALAWRRIEPGQEGCSTIVPLLICPDDADFSCTTVVVEQELRSDEVVWHRFGYAADLPRDQVGATVRWFRHDSALRFPRAEFTTALAELKRLTQEVWL